MLDNIHETHDHNMNKRITHQKQFTGCLTLQEKSKNMIKTMKALKIEVLKIHCDCRKPEGKSGDFIKPSLTNINKK